MADNKEYKKVSKNTDKKLNIVGIGTSAGGLKAIQELFDNMPGDTGFSFVIIQHLSPDYKSLMKELLSKHTIMQVYEAEDNMQVVADCIYLIPSKKIIRIKNGRLKLEDKMKTGQPTQAIDIFLESLAEEKDCNAIAIILSGTGTDGTRGLEAIKSEGGIIIVQDPITAEFDGMPNSAISTGCADLILSPEMMGDELVSYINEAPLIKSFNDLNKKDELLLKDILELVNSVTSHDFSQYKLPTISRRLARRMLEKNIAALEDYYKYLVANPEEVKALSKEFLINVTKFFRDPEAFDILSRQVLPSLFTEKNEGEMIKVWSVACSTGEEAYSLAIISQEYIDKYQKNDFNVKIFATDINQDALNTASRAVYSKDSLKDVSAERLNKFFTKDGDNYTVVPAIRKMVIFAKHDITKDPPFSKISLLSCRNMLIYMNTTLQKKILQSFHFALTEGGALFLGPSENTGSLKDHLYEIDKKWKIYKCITKAKLSGSDAFFSPLGKENYTSLSVTKSKNALNNLAEIFKETLLDEYQYAGIYINKDFEVKQAIGNFRNFMNFPQGNFNFNLLKLVPPDLSVALGVSVRKAIQTNETVATKRIKVHEEKEVRYVTIIVKPYLIPGVYLQPFLFIVLNEEAREKANARVYVPSDIQDESERVNMLEKELRELRENLQAVVEEVESANEELQSSNEEIISSNEELQSTNEELQSLNEELHTVNAEHQLKIKELVELNDDLDNYFQNSNIGQLLVDKKLIIRKFSPSVTRQINLIENDIGRPISDISTNFQYTNFVNDIKVVMKSGKPFEKEITLRDNKYCLMRISPYIRQDKSNDGVVINFIDISEVKGLNEIVKAVFNSSPNGIVALKSVKDSDGNTIDFEIKAANDKSAEMDTAENGKLTGKKLIADGALQVQKFFDKLVAAADDNDSFHSEYKNDLTGNWYDIDAIRMKDGLVITFTNTTQKKNADDLVTGSYKQLKEASDKLKATNGKLEQTNYDLLQFASVASHDLKEPLRKIQVYGNFLKDKLESSLDTQESKYLEKMLSASHRMQILIDDVLNLSRLSNSDFSLVPLSLNDIIDKIIDDLDITIKEKKAKILVHKLPHIKGVPGQMRQLFQNLISNSLKFNISDEPIISIEQRILTEEELALGFTADTYTCIEVSDNGIGFEKKFSDKIFGLFQRLNGNIYQGTGIGLAICKKIVGNHKGFITARGELGEGSVFRIILPLSTVNRESALPMPENARV